MKVILSMNDDFVLSLANGGVANAFQFTEVEPALSQGREVTMDLLWRDEHDEFVCNALVATLMGHHPEDFSARVRFANCDPLLHCEIALNLAPFSTCPSAIGLSS